MQTEYLKPTFFRKRMKPIYGILFFSGFTNAQQTSTDSCNLDDIDLPSNSQQWLCDKSVTDKQVPINTKCHLICNDGYEVQKREFKVQP